MPDHTAGIVAAFIGAGKDAVRENVYVKVFNAVCFEYSYERVFHAVEFGAASQHDVTDFYGKGHNFFRLHHRMQFLSHNTWLIPHIYS